MFPTVTPNSTNRVLRPDDIEGIRRLYPIRGPAVRAHSGTCLDIEGISTANGADAIQWDYWGGQNQVFRIEWVEAAHYRLIAQHSGRVIDVDGVSPGERRADPPVGLVGRRQPEIPARAGRPRLLPRRGQAQRPGARRRRHARRTGARVIQWDWWGGDNQQWSIGPAPIVARHSGKVLDVAGISIANGARLIQWGYWGGGNQRFRLDPVGDGYYRIMIEHSGKCLDVEGISPATARAMIQWQYWGGDNQKWHVEGVGDGYVKVLAKHSGRALDVSDISADDGAQVIQWDYWGGDNQKWRL